MQLNVTYAKIPSAEPPLYFRGISAIPSKTFDALYRALSFTQQPHGAAGALSLHREFMLFRSAECSGAKHGHAIRHDRHQYRSHESRLIVDAAPRLGRLPRLANRLARLGATGLGH